MVNLLDILDGKADTSNRTLSEKELEKCLQREGLLDEVNDTDFQMLKFEFSGIRLENAFLLLYFLGSRELSIL